MSNRDGYAAGIGRWTPGNVVTDKTGNVVDDGKPQFTAEDLAHIQAEPDAADIDAELDAETAQREASMKRLGFTDAEIQRQRGNAGEPEVAPTLASVQQELEQISELRRTDPKKFWGEETQKRQLRLIEQEMALKAGKAATPAPAASESETEAEAAEAPPEPTELAKVDARLKAISDARRADKRSYTADVEREELELLDRQEILKAGAENLPAELIETWRAQGGLRHNIDRARSTAEAVLDNGDILLSFDGLPENAQSVVYAHLALEPPRVGRPASDEQVNVFKMQGEACAAVVSGWGASAARRYAVAEARLDAMLDGMSEADAAATEAAFKKLPESQKAAIVATLAGR
jgi:hypothetical protein